MVSHFNNLPFRIMRKFIRGDVVRVTTDIEKLHKTQFLDREICEQIAGKTYTVSSNYPDGSYDLEWIKPLLDNSVLEYIEHPKKQRKGKLIKKFHKKQFIKK